MAQTVNASNPVYDWHAFVYGVLGSLAVEIVELWQEYYREEVTLPDRYRLWHFYIVRIILAMVGGALAVAYGISQPLLAANIGAATPVLIKALSRGLQNPEQPGSRRPANKNNANPKQPGRRCPANNNNANPKRPRRRRPANNNKA